MPHAAVPVGGPAEKVDPHWAHPLATSVATVNHAVGLLSFQLLDVSDDQWVICDHALSEPSFFAHWRIKAAQRLAERHPGVLDKPTAVPNKTTAGYVLQWYLIIPSYLGAVLFHSARRVPSLAPRQVGFRLDPAAGELRAVALRPGRFWCLPGDPDAGHPDAVPVADEAALGAVLRREVIAHATQFLAAYDPQVRFGHRTQWATVTDVLDSGLLLAGRSFGSPQAGASDARLVLADGEKPLTSASTICEVTDERGRKHWTRRRGSCCFLYALPGIERPCASCPRIGDPERAQIFSTLN